MKSLHRSAFAIALAGLTLITAGCASNGNTQPRAQMYYVDAKVLGQRPASDLCDYKKPETDSTGTVVGLVGGGLIGRQFGGDKSARNWGTGVGALLGAMMGAQYDKNNRDPRQTPKLECKRNGYLVTIGFIHPVTRVYQVTTVPMNDYTYAEFISVPVY